MLFSTLIEMAVLLLGFQGITVETITKSHHLHLQVLAGLS